MSFGKEHAENAAVWVNRTLRRWWPELLAFYLVIVLFQTSIAFRGFPWLNAYEQVAWILLGLVAATFRSWRRLTLAARDWLPFAVLLVVYGTLADRADNLTGQVHDVSGFDRSLFGVVPTVWLQHQLWHGTVRPFDIAVTFIYLSHFLSITLTLIILWVRDRRSYLQFVLPLLLLSAAALMTYAAFPAAPPWIASAEGHIEHVPRITNLAVSSFFGHDYQPGWDGYSPWNPADYRFGNPFAAVPSLHAAFPVLLILFFWRRAARTRIFLTVYAAGMFFAVIYLGEHYVIDIFLGTVYSVAAMILSGRIRSWNARRSRRSTKQESRPSSTGSDATSKPELAAEVVVAAAMASEPVSLDLS